jgi:hypothetical protein
VYINVNLTMMSLFPCYNGIDQKKMRETKQHSTISLHGNEPSLAKRVYVSPKSISLVVTMKESAAHVTLLTHPLAEFLQRVLAHLSLAGTSLQLALL